MPSNYFWRHFPTRPDNMSKFQVSTSKRSRVMTDSRRGTRNAMLMGFFSSKKYNNQTLKKKKKYCSHYFLRCAKELNQWDTVLEYGKNNATQNPFLILESAWKVPDWKLMKEALAQVEPSCPKESQWKVRYYGRFSHENLLV